MVYLPSGTVIEVKRREYAGGSDWHYLYVNGVRIGESYQPENYKNPMKWAQKQFQKRTSVIKKNIERLNKEIKELQDEDDKLYMR